MNYSILKKVVTKEHENNPPIPPLKKGGDKGEDLEDYFLNKNHKGEKMEPIELADDIIKKALTKGCDKAEVYIKTAKRLSVEAKDSTVDALESSMDFGMSLKVIKNQRLGFSFTTSPSSINEVIDDALKGSVFTAEDKYVDIPNPPHPPFNKGGMGGITSSDVLVMDSAIRELNEEDVIEKALLLERSALDFDERVRKVRKAEVSIAEARTTICNSKGINVSYESGVISANLTTLASDGKDSQMGWDFAISRRPDDIDPISVAKTASKRAIDLLGARKISAVNAPVILEHSVASEFLSILSASISAESVQKKRSFLSDKIGKAIVSPLINIIDDGLMPWGIGTKPVDDEGVAASKKSIFSKGVLNCFIHNTYTAKKAHTASTGNASRSSFKSLPGIGTTNFYIQPIPPNPPLPKGGRGDLKGEKHSLIKSMSRGLLILEAMGVHTADPISGDFSIGISGLWIEGGEPAYPVKEAVISGNILDLFNKVEKVGNDLRFYGKIGSPSLLIGDMDISA